MYLQKQFTVEPYLVYRITALCYQYHVLCFYTKKKNSTLFVVTVYCRAVEEPLLNLIVKQLQQFKKPIFKQNGE